jgi:group I intron endonuclease
MDAETNLCYGAMEENRFYVYALIDPRNKETFYVGKGTKDRVSVHGSESNRGHNPQKDAVINEIKKTGKSIRHAKVASGLPEDEAYELEEFVIEELGLESLTNMIPGGVSGLSGEHHHNFGKELSEETKKAISESNTGKLKGENHPNWGKKRSEAVKEKISDTLKGKLTGEDVPFYGKTHSEEQKEEWRKQKGNKVTDGERTFNSTYEAAEYYGISQPAISYRLKADSFPKFEYINK